jgi:NAD(P)-dependent dehydrogenase (short-subunit alcohol dehydrogenase family)
MVLKSAASFASTALIMSNPVVAGVLGFVARHPSFEHAAATLGITRDSPYGVLLAACLITTLPLALATTVLRVTGARRRRTLRYADDADIKVVLVTGASGGIGALIVAAMRDEFPDAVVYGTSRSGWVEEGGGSQFSEHQLPLGVSPTDLTGTQPLLQLDITDETSVQRCIQSIKQKHGRLDVLVNNAGSVVATHAGRTFENDAAEQIATNFFGAVRTVRHCIPLMMIRTCNDSNGNDSTSDTSRNRNAPSCNGRVINIGSIGGRIGLPFQSMYSASKAALSMWSDALRMEVWTDGIFVSLVEPGDLKPGMINARKAQGFDDDLVGKRATDIMRAEEAVGTDPKHVAKGTCCISQIQTLFADCPE